MPQIKKQVGGTIAKRTTSSLTPTSKYSSVLDRIRGIEFGEDDGIKLLLYGRSGTGKTTMWATFPGPILAVICSGGNRPGELRSIDTPEVREKVRQVALEKSSELVELIDYAKSEGFATVVLDHASGLQDLVLKELLGLEEIPVAKTWGLATQQQYGQCTVQCKELFRSLLGLERNVVIVAQERVFGDESAGDSVIAPFVGPSLMPILGGWLNSAVDYIGETFIRQREEDKKVTIGQGKAAKTMIQKVKLKGQVDYCLRTAPDPTYATKFRVPKGQPLPDVIVDATYSKIVAVIRGEA